MSQAWFNVEQTAKLAKLYRTIAAVRRLNGEMIQCRAAEANARKYEAELRDLATEIELHKPESDLFGKGHTSPMLGALIFNS